MNLIQKDIDQAKGFNDLVEIVRDFGLSLKREGRNYRALCPFHSDNGSSLIINPIKQLFSCTGCGVSGDVISFVMKIKNLTFGDAVGWLLEKAGMEEEKQVELLPKHYKLLTRIADFYHDRFMENKRGMEYLVRRV